MTIIALLKKQLEDSRWNFEHTASDITLGQLHTDPGGKAHPLGATYAHVLFTEDILIQGLFQGVNPLYSAKWKNKTGVSAPMPSFLDPNWAEENTKWASSVKIDLSQMQKYQKAVFKSTDAYMDKLTTKELSREVQVGGLGKRTIVQLLTNFVIGHMENVTDEIAVLKGLQGAKGYPF